jgi:hypothetical protein
MAKRLVLILALVVFLSGGVFAQKPSKHQPGDMLLGINYGMGTSPNVLDIAKDEIPKGNYALFGMFLGLNYDYYLTNWLSFNSGLSLSVWLYIFLNKPVPKEIFQNLDDKALIDYDIWAKQPLIITVPFNVHINVPKVEWLYLGAGVNLNFPMERPWVDEELDIDPAGKFFIGLPIDLGFDFIKSGRGGVRLFFRVTPEFHEGRTVVPISLNWQIWNWKIR